MPDSVEIIWQKAFDNCTSLREIKLSNNLQQIQSSAFYNCKSLIYIELPNSLNQIDGYVFQNSSVTTLKFLGTSEQWQSITKNNYWKYNIPVNSIECLDGFVDF